MLNKSLAVLLLISAAVLSACEKSSESYPITGEQCGPEDPVKTLDAADCYVPPAVN
ncbi:hypothetical protein HW561_18020 [Rhodobacteraceae bacterium B1Z28]|uniref:Lipoprotein n=1 Tax=Ruegeria haliotis TaxID=2747601 RepID=A0ABX2PU41_9RHOB|nr:hypothetical protein [Ruegeria haliotis]NVO57698.1 hypothetical protein [Ruegeria haliotis]